MSELKDLILEKDTVINRNLVCRNIRGKDGGKFNLTVKGNITAWDIDALNITALNITAGDINAWDITAGDITAWDIDALNITAWDIFCVSRKKKNPKSKTIAYSIVLDKFGRKQKEVMPEKAVEK